jgi:hypothetical protein
MALKKFYPSVSTLPRFGLMRQNEDGTDNWVCIRMIIRIQTVVTSNKNVLFDRVETYTT